MPNSSDVNMSKARVRLLGALAAAPGSSDATVSGRRFLAVVIEKLWRCLKNAFLAHALPNTSSITRRCNAVCEILIDLQRACLAN